MQDLAKYIHLCNFMTPTGVRTYSFYTVPNIIAHTRAINIFNSTRIVLCIVWNCQRGCRSHFRRRRRCRAPTHPAPTCQSVSAPTFRHTLMCSDFVLLFVCAAQIIRVSLFAHTSNASAYNNSCDCVRVFVRVRFLGVRGVIE